jgi:hypothetical protein
MTISNIETFEKCLFFPKFKEGDNFNHPRGICFAFHRAGRNTLSIMRINPPKFGGGLKFEPVGMQCRSRFIGDAEIGQKGGFTKVSHTP